MNSHSQTLSFREARHDDLRVIARMLADDALGATRDASASLHAYASALEAVKAQAGNTIIVALLGDDVVGMLQLTMIPGLSRGGMLRAQIESVRVDKAYRGRRIGKALFEHAIEQARMAGCGLVQLTSDKQRSDALRFYEDLGFAASHEGLKLSL